MTKSEFIDEIRYRAVCAALGLTGLACTVLIALQYAKECISERGKK